MTVRIGDITFSDWVSLPLQGGWSDTFVFRISAHSGLPPFSYICLVKHLARRLRRIRPNASIWIQLDSPGDWFRVELRRCLGELCLAYAITHAGIPVNHLDFSYGPDLYDSPVPPPLFLEENPPCVTPEELRILQVLGRIKKGDEQGIAILAGLSEETTCTLLNSLARKKITVHQINKRISRSKSRVPKMDSHPLWVNSSKGNSQALRSWGVPVRTSFRNRFEEHLPQIDTKHRRISRAGIAWLKAAWPYAEIWTGWSEVRIPDTYVVPDALAWGRIHGYETLIWLEVGDEHKSRKTIKDVTIKRLRKAHFLCKRTGARLVYVQLSPRWVLEAAGSVCRGLPQEVAVVLGGWRRFGKLPIVEWGQVTKWY